MSSNKRMVHSQFYESLTIAELTIRQRYLLTGMIVNADDQGRIVADPRWLKHKILPYDDILLKDITADLEAIAERNDTVILYEVDGRTYAQFQNWWEYQSLQWAGPSDHPAPEDWQDKIRRLMYQPCRWVQTINWPGSKDVVSYEESPQSDDKNGRNNPGNSPTDAKNDPTDALGDESLRELDYASRSEQGDLLADTSANFNIHSNVNLNNSSSGKGGVGEKPNPVHSSGLAADYQQAVREMTDALAETVQIDIGIDKNRDKVELEAIWLLKAGYTAAQVLAGFGSGGYWYMVSYGRNGRPPELGNIRSEIKRAVEWFKNGKPMPSPNGRHPPTKKDDGIPADVSTWTN